MEIKEQIKIYGEQLKQCTLRRQQLSREFDGLTVKMNELTGAIKALQDLGKEDKKTKKNGKAKE